MSPADPQVGVARSESSRAIRWAVLALVLATFAAYANGFRTPFVFDDVPTIVENASIRRLWPLSAVLAPQQAGGLTVSGRPVVSLSLALNYALSGDHVWSYHAVNVLIHLAAGLALFGIVRRTLLRPVFGPAWAGAATPLALAMAAVWTLHPLQTESVTYIVQRAESLAGLFYLLTLYGFIRWAAPDAGAPRGQRGWLVVSVVACLLGMASKETAVSAPLIVWLYDRTFLAGTFRAAWAQRRGFYLSLGATWLLLAILVLGTGGRGGTAGFTAGISPWLYLLTQCRAIVLYLARAIWPDPLVFDYGQPVVRGPVEVLPQAVVVLALLGGTIFALRREPVLGFLGAWFFASLAPSSSIVPVITQTVAEHRMYLPLAAVVALAVGGSFAWLGRRSLAGWAAAAIVLGGVTLHRNGDYRSEIAIWADTARKVPANARAHNNLGQALFRAGDIAGSIRCYQEALRLQPKYPETHYNYGVALSHEDHMAEAIEHYETALRYEPAYPEAHNNLGNALARIGRPAEALPHYAEALRLKPDFPETVGNQGNALLQLGRAEEAIPWFQRALQLRPDHAESHYNLGNAFAAVGRMPEALAAYRRALALKPDFGEARVNAGNALLALERPAEAVREYEIALAADSKLGVAHLNAGLALLDLERWADAIPHFEAVLRLQPATSQAERGLGHALVKLGRVAEAIPHYERYVRAEPGDAGAQQELAALRARVR